MEARHLLKQLKDEDWYLGDTEGACRQYIHPERPGVITVCVRFTDELGAETLAAATDPATDAPTKEPEIAVEETSKGASAYSPDVPGCVATGEGEADARQRMSEALALHMSRLRRTGGEGAGW